jgi:hypothetical protein
MLSILSNMLRYDLMMVYVILDKYKMWIELCFYELYDEIRFHVMLKRI